MNTVVYACSYIWLDTHAHACVHTYTKCEQKPTAKPGKPDPHSKGLKRGVSLRRNLLTDQQKVDLSRVNEVNVRKSIHPFQARVDPTVQLKEEKPTNKTHDNLLHI